MSIQDYNSRLENNNTNLNEILNAINTLPTLKLQDKSVIPTKEKQTIQAEDNYSGLGIVNVEAIPSSYVEPSGELNITTNGTYDVKNYESVTTNVHEPTPYAPRFISFYQCDKTDLIQELASLDTSNMTSFKNMFNYCYNLTSLDVNHFNTSNVTNMYGTFSGCSNLTSLDISNWDTSKVTNMQNMFSAMGVLTNLTLGDNFDTSNVTDMSSMFSGGYALTELDLSIFNTSKVTRMNSMFQNCNKLMKIDIRNFDFTKVTNYSYMFSSVKATCEIIVKDDTAKSWITSKFTNLTNVKTVAEL